MNKNIPPKKLVIKSIENNDTITNLVALRINKFSSLVNALEKLKLSSSDIDIKIHFGEEEFKIVYNHPQQTKEFTKRLKVNSEKYKSLSNKELTILCFLYRGYKQAQIAFSLNISVNTYRQHRKRLYKKMGFNTKYELNYWCDSYLNTLFKNLTSKLSWIQNKFEVVPPLINSVALLSIQTINLLLSDLL